MTEGPALEVWIEDRVLCASVAGDIDLSNAADLEREIARAAGDVRPLVLDLSAVTFLDSAGVRLLDHLVAVRAPEPEVRVVVPAAGPVPFTLRLCGFPTELMAESAEAARAALRQG